MDADFIIWAIVIGIVVLFLILIILGLAAGFVATAMRLFAWAAAEWGFAGIALYVIVWAVATPLMVIVCLIGAFTGFYRDDADDITEYRPSSSLPFESDDLVKHIYDNAESLALIEELLTGFELSDEGRKELEVYKMQIANGAWKASDHRYIRAFYDRLTKSV